MTVAGQSEDMRSQTRHNYQMVTRPLQNVQVEEALLVLLVEHVAAVDGQNDLLEWLEEIVSRCGTK